MFSNFLLLSLDQNLLSQLKNLLSPTLLLTTLETTVFSWSMSTYPPIMGIKPREMKKTSYSGASLLLSTRNLT
jgi:hypothetical protein